MNRHSAAYLVVAILLTVAGAYALSCGILTRDGAGAGATEHEPSTTGQLDAPVAGYDFTADIEQQVYIDSPGASREVDAMIGIKAASAVPQWPGDDKVLGLKHIVGGHCWTTQSTLSLISKYFVVHGQLPETGYELYPELLTGDGYDEFVAMTPTERIIRYHAGINPYTARFYKSFTDPGWRAGGLFIDYLRVDDNGDILGKGALPVRFVEDNEDTPAEVDGAFYYEVYSAKEGITLFDDYCTFTYELPTIKQRDGT